MTDYKCHGVNHRHAKLNEQIVKLILSTPVKDKSNKAWADELNVAPITIRRVRAGDNWKHVPRPREKAAPKLPPPSLNPLKEKSCR